MDQERLWERLIEALDAWTSASQTAAGEIEVSLPDEADPDRRVLIVMTPDQWEDMATVMWGNVDSAVDDVTRTLSALRPHERYAVYHQYALEPSATPTLVEPETPDVEPGGDGGPPVGPPRKGRWVAMDRDDNVAGGFPDPPGPAQYTD